jgi:hypothetical protein
MKRCFDTRIFALLGNTNSEINRWNGPWYSRMGFFEVNVQDMGRAYLQILESEAQHFGLDLRSRCVMRKIL